MIIENLEAECKPKIIFFYIFLQFDASKEVICTGQGGSWGVSIRTSNASEPEWGWVPSEEMSRKGSEGGQKRGMGTTGCSSLLRV